MPNVWKKSLFAPAKINLALSILGKLPSGYHALQSILAPLRFGDQLRVEVSEDPSGDAPRVSLILTFSEKLQAAFPCLTMCPEKENLAYRAADGFCRLFFPGEELAVLIQIEKRVPWQAGLGGGSSDAAAVIRALLEYALERGQRFDPEAVLSFALSLGADVPALLVRQLCLVEGVGGQLTLLGESSRALSSLRLLIVKPPFASSTEEAFRAAGKPLLELSALKLDEANVAPLSLTVLEEAAFPKKPILKIPEDWKRFIEAFGSASSREFAGKEGEFLTNYPWEICSEELTNPSSEVTSVLDSEKLAVISKLSNEFGALLKQQYPLMVELETLLLEGGAFHCLLAGSGSSLIAFFEADAEQSCRNTARKVSDYFNKIGDLTAGSFFVEETTFL